MTAMGGQTWRLGAGIGLGALGLALLLVLVLMPERGVTRTVGTTGDLRVLWLGNSHTYLHDLPRRTAARLAEAGRPARITSRAADAMSLSDHLREGWPAAALDGRDWDVIVLQSRTHEPLLDPRRLIAALDRITEAAIPAGAARVLYTTWALHPDHPAAGTLHAGRTPAAAQAEIDAFFAWARLRYAATLAPAGRAVTAAVAAGRPVLDPDGLHLSETGAELAADILSAAILAAAGDA